MIILKTPGAFGVKFQNIIQASEHDIRDKVSNL